MMQAEAKIPFTQAKRRNIATRSSFEANKKPKTSSTSQDQARPAPSSAPELIGAVNETKKNGVSDVQEHFVVATSSTEMHTPDQLLRERRIGKKAVTLPTLEVKRSKVPGSGLGVFTTEDIPKHGWVTEYGGEVVQVCEARNRRVLGDDTHIRSCGYMDICLDSRVRATWDLDYYKRHHMVGGFLNDAHGTGLPNNCVYTVVECNGYQHPYASGPWVSKRVFLKATRDIKAGDELFVSYGSTYHTIHFDS